MPPPKLAPGVHRLPPILHKQFLVSVASCSKGSWGLSVLPRVNCIGTAISISLSPWSRQRGSRYSIRAGRNLPDKEFRYLRTVIVTAAVYRGFGSSLWPYGLTNHLNLPAPGRSQSVYVGLDNALARSCVFAKQSLETILCGRFPLPLYMVT